MKTKYVCFSLFLVFLFLAGCGTKTVYVCIDGTEVTDTALCPTTSETTAEDASESVSSSEESVEEQVVAEASEETFEQTDYTLSDAEKALLEERFIASSRAVLSTPIVKALHPGDVYVAGLALRNILGAADHDFG